MQLLYGCIDIHISYETLHLKNSLVSILTREVLTNTVQGSKNRTTKEHFCGIKTLEKRIFKTYLYY